MSAPERMNVLILGSGGREHALAWAVARSPRLKRLLVLPGNAGTAALGENVPGDPCDFGLVLEVARREEIDLVIVGPEEPLARGVADALEAAGRRVFGPSAAAARIEADKAWAKALMRQHAVPTAEARVFENYRAARQYISTRDEPVVVKAAGLARGKGVVVCEDPADAILAAERILRDRVLGEAGAKIVVEERLNGREVSVLCLVDGHTIYVLDPARDYKRLGEGDSGPNTGGMGAYSPVPDLTPELLRRIESEILVPTVDALVRQGIHYRGVLYAGLMLTPAGPKVLEFNCRFGDPETQVLLPRLRGDVLEVLAATVEGGLEQVEISWDPQPAVCTVMASAGYPESARVGAVIEGLPEEGAWPDCIVFHAGTRREGPHVVTAGGRVLGVTALGATVEQAAERSLAGVKRIRFEGAVYRRDIGRAVRFDLAGAAASE